MKALSVLTLIPAANWEGHDGGKLPRAIRDGCGAKSHWCFPVKAARPRGLQPRNNKREHPHSRHWCSCRTTKPGAPVSRQGHLEATLSEARVKMAGCSAEPPIADHRREDHMGGRSAYPSPSRWMPNDIFDRLEASKASALEGCATSTVKASPQERMLRERKRTKARREGPIRGASSTASGVLHSGWPAAHPSPSPPVTTRQPASEEELLPQHLRWPDASSRQRAAPSLTASRQAPCHRPQWSTCSLVCALYRLRRPDSNWNEGKGGAFGHHPCTRRIKSMPALRKTR